MNKNRTILYATLHAALAAVYVGLVALLLRNAEGWFGPAQGSLGVAAFLLTFVFSAAVMGVLIFGRPAAWYLGGAKREAVYLLALTLGFLLLITLAVFLALAA